MSSAPTTGRIPPDDGSNSSSLSAEYLKHLLEGHLTIAVKDDTLSITINDCEEDGCPVPPNISVFYCRQPPCPK